MQLELMRSTQAEDVEGQYDPKLSQWMTPAWAAEAIVGHCLHELRSGATVIEPSCGIGRFIHALPAGTRAIGVEIDPRLARRARSETQAEIIEGDFRIVDLPVDRCDALIGNPPFRMDVFDGMLDRAYGLLDDGGPMIMILPAFALQTTSRVARYNRRWSISQDMLPRTLFPGIRLPLVLARFVRDPVPRLHGFLLYHESREIEEMPVVYRRALSEGRSGWKAVVEEALKRLGGEGTIAQVCAEIGPRRPTSTEHWRAKVRQQLSTHFNRRASATYSLAA